MTSDYPFAHSWPVPFQLLVADKANQRYSWVSCNVEAITRIFSSAFQIQSIHLRRTIASASSTSFIQLLTLTIRRHGHYSSQLDGVLCLACKLLPWTSGIFAVAAGGKIQPCWIFPTFETIPSIAQPISQAIRHEQCAWYWC
ncbi:Mitochondria-eating protein [Trichinella pseudospiralis]